MTELPADTIAIGLGGNVGTVAQIVERFRRAREALGALGDVRSAALYRSAAIGPIQPAFVNSAVRVRATPAPTAAELVDVVQELERLLGRDRAHEVRFGPRPIDLDVLLWGARELRHLGPPALDVPHPRLGERRFALVPLVDLFGAELIVPGLGATLGALADRVAAQHLEALDATW